MANSSSFYQDINILTTFDVTAQLAALLSNGGGNSPLAKALITIIQQLPTDASITGPTLHSNGGVPQYS